MKGPPFNLAKPLVKFLKRNRKLLIELSKK